MTISDNNSQDVKLDYFSDKDDVPFNLQETLRNDAKYSEKVLGNNRSNSIRSDHCKIHEKKAKLLRRSVESSLSSEQDEEEIENSNNAANFIEIKEISRFKGENEQYNIECESIPEKASEKFGRVIMLDLDNTLIPTNWIMHTWRNIQYEIGNEGDIIDYSDNENTLFELTEQIRNELIQVGLFDLLEKFFSDLWEIGKATKIVIVTNAGLRTVELFYLKYCLPRLNELLKKYNITIRSTEDYIRKKGPPPSPFREEDYREFYTNAKLSEFQKVLLDCWKENKDYSEDEMILDIISAGDQACEITAACRISKFYENRIRRTKLIYIHDPDDFRFWKQKPENFIFQLLETHVELLNLLSDDSETLVNYNDMNSTGLTNIGEENEEEVEEVALGWYCRGKYINIAVSKPERFVLPQGSSAIYLDAERKYFEKEISSSLFN